MITLAEILAALAFVAMGIGVALFLELRDRAAAIFLASFILLAVAAMWCRAGDLARVATPSPDIVQQHRAAFGNHAPGGK